MTANSSRKENPMDGKKVALVTGAKKVIGLGLDRDQ
jgi:hypothetical protein